MSFHTGLVDVGILTNVTWRSFHQHFTLAFFIQKLRSGSFSSYILALVTKFRTKNVSVNVDEIDTRAQFH